MKYGKLEAQRLFVKLLGVAAAVIALIGGIGFLIVRSQAASGSVSAASDMSAVKALNLIMTFYDLARFGASSLFGIAMVLSVTDKSMGGTERRLSLFTSCTSSLALAGVIITSVAVETGIGVVIRKAGVSPPDTKTVSSVANIISTAAYAFIILAAAAMIFSFAMTVKLLRSAVEHTPAEGDLQRTALKSVSHTVAAAALSGVGAVGLLIVQGILMSGVSDMETKLYVTVLAIALWDIVRLGGFGIFVRALLTASAALCGGCYGVRYALMMFVGSLFGAAAAFMLSVQAMYSALTRLTFSTVNGMIIHGGDYAIPPNMTFLTVPCIFAMISAGFVFTAVGLRSVRSGGRSE